MRARARLAALTTLVVLAARPAVAQGVHEAPVNAPSRAALANATEPGTKLNVSGRVLGADGKAIAGASIYVYQTDAKGEYVPGTNGGSDRPRLFAYLRSDANGRYAYTTVRPGSYPGTSNPGHIHYEVVAPGHQPRVYEIVFEGDPVIPEQFRAQARAAFGSVAIVATRTTGDGALQVDHDVRVQAK